MAMPIIAGVVAVFLLTVQLLAFAHVHGDPDHHHDHEGHTTEECDFCFVATHSSCDLPVPIAVNVSVPPATFAEVTLTELWLPPANINKAPRAPPVLQT